MQRQKKSSPNPRNLTAEEQIQKRACELSHLYFTRYFFKQRQSIKFRINWHHHLIADTLERVITGELRNVIVNVPPGSSKTELAVINFIARGLALNPRCRFLHLSYSDDLALQNSQAARDLVESDEYQSLWPMPISDDDKAKKRWNVMLDGKKAGGVYAAASGGQITGFRAGHMAEGFQGALIIDDPLKPEDAFSESKLKQANRRLLTTIKSRKANPLTPIILIMQRISENDPTGFITKGVLGNDWYHLVIPAIIDDAYIASIPEKYRSMIDVSEGRVRYSYWPYKEPIDELLAIESGQGTDAEGARMSRHVFAGQYMQNPIALGGNLIRGVWFPRYRILPKIKQRKIFADTAQKTKERNDYSVFECWGLGDDGRIYLLDMIRGKWEGPELKRRAVGFWAKQAGINCDNFGTLLPWVENPPTDPAMIGQLRKMVVEDKSSGTDLIQSIRLLNTIPIQPLERVTDKLTRVMDVQSYWEAKLACVPELAPFTNDFITECEAFTADDSHAFDDQIDPACDAVIDLLSSGNRLRTWERLGQ